MTNERLPNLTEDKPLFTDELEIDPKIAFAKRFKELFKGMTNAKVARQLKTTDMVVKNYMDGNRLPTYELQLRIFDATGVNLHWLITGEGPRFAEGLTTSFSDEQTAEIQELAKKNGVTFNEQVGKLITGSLEFLRNI